MKSKLTTRLCLLIVAGMMMGAGTLRAEDYGIQESRVKIWKLLKDERPDYYGERETGQDRAQLKVMYSDVENTASTLVEEQNEFIATSLGKEEIDLGLVWPVESVAVTAKADSAFSPEIAAAVEEQISAAVRSQRPAPVSVRESVVLSKAEVSAELPRSIVEADEPVVVVAGKEPTRGSAPAVVKSRVTEFANKQAQKDREAEEEILRQLIEEGESSASSEPTRESIARHEDVSVDPKAGVLSGVKSFFTSGKRVSVNEAVAGDEAEEEIAAASTEDMNKFEQMRRILDDDELEEINSTTRPTMKIEKKIVYTEEEQTSTISTAAASGAEVEELPAEIQLVKVSDEPLKALPNPVIIHEADQTEDQVAMNKGIIYQQDIPETQESSIVEPVETKAVKPVSPKGEAEKAVSKKTIKSPKKAAKRSEESMEEEFMALRDSMRKVKESAAKPDGESAETEMHEPEEDLVTKIKRKLSPSGLLEEEVAELDYWDVPVEEQTVEDISRNLKIEQALKEAASIKLPEQPDGPPIQRRQQQKTTVISPEEIVRQAIPPQNRSKRIDLDFDNTNLSDILLIMGEAGDMNIMLDPSLKSNTLDLHLKQISLEDALLLIAQSYDLGFKLVGKALFITENEKLRYENKVSRMIKVRNVNVQEAKNLVEDLADNVSVSEELNSLIVTGDPKDVVQVEQLVEMLDNPQPQVILEAKIIEVDKNALKDLGVDWSDQINLLYQESGRPQEFANVEDSSSGIYRIAQIQRNPVQFETTIRMLEQQNKAKVLSAPRVSTLNGKEAQIFVGDEVPYTITNITGGVVTNDVRFVEPGIRLTITPSIIEENFVVMKVEPEVSFIVAFRGPNDEFPQVRTREATAHVRVENKQPFVLGGILNQEDKQSLFKVPFFGDLPLFGNLFSYERNTAVDTELIITVIPTIVHGRD